ncbi:MAG: ABC transporter ATP-binding protein [Hyphomicrobium sp.]
MLLGPNGAGKSLLVRVLTGLLRADSGRVTWSGTEPDRKRIVRIGLVFQKPVLLLRTVEANIVFALRATGMPAAGCAACAHDALEKAGLSHLAHTSARVLSGGEQQRLALTRAVACQPELLILDEPTTNLDPASIAAFEDQLQLIRAAGVPILCITHDLGQARRLADHVAFMHLGRVREVMAAAEFFAKPRSREAAQFIAGQIVLS